MVKVKEIAIITVIMLLLDASYIGMTSKYFQVQIAEVQRVSLQPRIGGAILCYLCLIFGLYYFIVMNRRPILDALLLGLVIYGVYEGTTYAILKKWKWQTVMMDTLWGGVLFALTTAITYRLM